MDALLRQSLLNNTTTTRQIASSHTCRSRASLPKATTLAPRVHRQRLSCRAAETEKEQSEPAGEAAPVQQEDQSTSGNWVPVCKPEEVPKGFRREVVADGVDVMLFWYRNKLYAIEARSPAEGAYSEGFVNSRLNQDYCIACPSTGTLFSLKTGEIVEWYPNNPVLRFITPKNLCRKLEIYPVKLTQQAISVDVSGATSYAASSAGKGGSDTSIDLNNVFGVESRPYYEAENPVTGEYDVEAANRVNPYVIGVSFFAIVFAGVAGSAFAIYKESYIGLGLLWILILAVAAYSVVNYTPLGNKKQ